MIFLLFFLLLIIGFLLGLSGIGGFLIPLILIYIFNINIREAIVITLGSSILIFLISFFIYNKKKLVSFHLSKYLILGALPGILLGLTTNIYFPDHLLKLFLGFFLVFISMFLLLEDKVKLKKEYNKIIKHNKLFLSFGGFFSGIMAGLIGVGGPVITVPILIFMGYKPKISIGTSIFSGIFTVFFAFSFHLFYTQVNLIKVFLIGLFISVGSLIGAYSTSKSNQKLSKNIIIIVTIFSSIYLFLFN